MPYISKLDRERARWIKLTDALAHIQAAEKCDLDGAWHQLHAAIADEEVEAKWGDVWLDRPGGPSKFRVFRDGLNNKGTKVLDTPGRMFVPRKLIAKARHDGRVKWRSVLVLSESVERIWGKPPPPPSNFPGIKPPGARSAKAQIEQALSEMKAQGEHVEGHQGRLADQLATKLAKKLDKDRGWSTRTVVQHISNWQKAQC